MNASPTDKLLSPSDPAWPLAVLEMERDADAILEPATAGPAERTASDGLLMLRATPHVMRHLHWLATQHGLNLVHKARAVSGDDYQRVLDEQRLNGVALVQLTQLVRREVA